MWVQEVVKQADQQPGEYPVEFPCSVEVIIAVKQNK